MSNVTFVGNLVADPELRTSADGKNRATFRLAIDGGKNRDGSERESQFVNVTAFGRLGENIVTSLRKGQSVFVEAKIDVYKKSYNIDGEERQLEHNSYTAFSAGPNLLWQTAQVTKAGGNAGQAAAPAQPQAAAPAAAAPAAAPAAVASDNDF